MALTFAETLKTEKGLELTLGQVYTAYRNEALAGQAQIPTKWYHYINVFHWPAVLLNPAIFWLDAHVSNALKGSPLLTDVWTAFYSLTLKPFSSLFNLISSVGGIFSGRPTVSRFAKDPGQFLADNIPLLPDLWRGLVLSVIDAFSPRAGWSTLGRALGLKEGETVESIQNAREAKKEAAQRTVKAATAAATALQTRVSNTEAQLQENLSNLNPSAPDYQTKLATIFQQARTSVADLRGVKVDSMIVSTLIDGALEPAFRQVTALESQATTSDLTGLHTSLTALIDADKGDAMLAATQMRLRILSSATTSNPNLIITYYTVVQAYAPAARTPAQMNAIAAGSAASSKLKEETQERQSASPVAATAAVQTPDKPSHQQLFTQLMSDKMLQSAVHSAVTPFQKESAIQQAYFELCKKHGLEKTMVSMYTEYMLHSETLSTSALIDYFSKPEATSAPTASTQSGARTPPLETMLTKVEQGPGASITREGDAVTTGLTSSDTDEQPTTPRRMSLKAGGTGDK